MKAKLIIFLLGFVCGLSFYFQKLIFPKPIFLDFVTPKSLLFQWPEHDKNLTNSRGNRLELYRWLPEKLPPKALLFFFNGYADYCDHYAHIVHEFVEEGFACFCMDVEGTGRSEGMRGYFPNLNDTLRDDQLKYVEMVKKQYGKKIKSFGIGASLGGAAVFTISATNPNTFDGAILLCPALEVDEKMYPILRKIARIIAFIIPTVPITPNILEDKAGEMCVDQNVEYAYRHDPFFWKYGMRAATGVAFLDLFEFIQQNLENLEVPFLILHGDRDTLIPLSESQKLYSKAKSKDKTLHVLPGEFHDLLHAPNYLDYYQMIFQWIEKRLN